MGVLTSQAILNVAYALNLGMTIALPCVFRSLEREFNIGPKQLGSLTLWMWLSASVVSLGWGFAADSYALGQTLAVGLLIMSFGLLGLGGAQSVPELALFTAVGGIGISSIIPVVQKFVSDAHEESERGRWYGVLGLSGAFGGLLSSTMAIYLSNTFVGTLSGWRVLFVAMGLICLLTAVLSYFLLITPQIPARNAHTCEEHTSLIQTRSPSPQPTPPTSPSLLQWMHNLRHLMHTPTVIAFAASWTLSAFVLLGSFEFVLLWLQYIGFSDMETALVFGLFQAGTGVGQLVGGWAGDWLSVRHPDSGRTLASGAAFLVAICLVSILFWVMPQQPDKVGLYAVVMCITGMFCNVSFAACDLPVMAEVVQHDMRASAVGVLQALSGIVGAFGAYLVGFVAEDVYGYVPTSADIATMDPGMRVGNCHALSEAISLGILVPWAGNLLAYAFILVSYPTDRDRVRKEERLASRGGEEGGERGGEEISTHAESMESHTQDAH